MTTENKKAELKPCPFCGASKDTDIIMIKRATLYAVGCDNCGVICGSHGRKEVAINNWNTRQLLAPDEGDFNGVCDICNEGIGVGKLGLSDALGNCHADCLDDLPVNGDALEALDSIQAQLHKRTRKQTVCDDMLAKCNIIRAQLTQNADTQAVDVEELKDKCHHHFVEQIGVSNHPRPISIIIDYLSEQGHLKAKGVV